MEYNFGLAQVSRRFLKDAFFCPLPAESQEQSFLGMRRFIKLQLLTGAQRQEMVGEGMI